MVSGFLRPCRFCFRRVPAFPATFLPDVDDMPAPEQANADITDNTCYQSGNDRTQIEWEPDP